MALVGEGVTLVRAIKQTKQQEEELFFWGRVLPRLLFFLFLFLCE